MSLKSRQKRQRDTRIPIVRMPQNTKVTAIAMQRAGCRSRRPCAGQFHFCEPCLVDSMGHVLLVSYIPSDSYSFSSLLPKLWGKRFDENLQLSLSVCIMSVYGVLHPLPSAADGSLCDGNWTRHQSTSRAEYHKESLHWFSPSHVWFYPGYLGYPTPGFRWSGRNVMASS